MPPYSETTLPEYCFLFGSFTASALQLHMVHDTGHGWCNRQTIDTPGPGKYQNAQGYAAQRKCDCSAPSHVSHDRIAKPRASNVLSRQNAQTFQKIGRKDDASSADCPMRCIIHTHASFLHHNRSSPSCSAMMRSRFYHSVASRSNRSSSLPASSTSFFAFMRM
jgi:hypothetical protein